LKINYDFAAQKTAAGGDENLKFKFIWP